jgi:hypothetical protein
MNVEAVNVAVGMGDCAVALFEAQAVRPGGRTNLHRHLYPERLEPTIIEWSAMYPAAPAHPRVDPKLLVIGTSA